MENSLTRTPQSFAAAKWPNSWTAIRTPKIRMAARIYTMVMEKLPSCYGLAHARASTACRAAWSAARMSSSDGVLLDGHRRPGLCHQAGNVVKADLLRQEEAHRRLVGAVEDGAGGAPLLGRLLRQAQAGECLPVRLARRSEAGRSAGPGAPPDCPPGSARSGRSGWAAACPACPAGPARPRPGTPPGSGRCSAGGSPPTPAPGGRR